jgi:predicted lipoprotein with Yx(FWY)xxD motif
MKRTYVIGGIVAAAVLAGGGAATGVALAGGQPGTAYGAAATPQAGTQATPAADGIATATLAPGTALVDGAGRTLYLFEADTGATSTCNGQCAQVWPPLLDTGTPIRASGDVQAGLLGTTTRADGTRQVTYHGHPLYYFMGDKKPGDAHGQGINRFGGGWYVVTPAGDKIDTNAPAAAPAPAPAPAPAGGGYGY